MAKVEAVEIPDELKIPYRNSLERRDRFQLGVIQGHKRLPSRREARLLRRTAVVNSPMEGRGSLFKYLSPIWRGLTTEQKAVWAEAAAFSSITNWQLFISDNAARIRNSLTLNIPPSNLWQVRAGHITIVSPATEITLKQEHPLNYWISRKVVGASWKNELVLLAESFTLPLEIGIRYKSNLTAEGSGQVARFFARVWTSVQGQDLYNDITIDFDPSTDWVLDTASLSSLPGILIGYTLYFQIEGYRGEFLFDNIRATHGGTNWALDPRCDDVSKTFTKGFAVVPPFWIPVSLPSGAQFVSVFPPALA